MAQETQLKIFFDFDGTLIDVSTRHYRVYSELAAMFGGKPLTKQVYWELKRAKAAWPDILIKSKLTPDVMDDFLAEFIKRIEDPAYLQLDKLLPDSKRVLQGLRKSYELFLVSLRRNENNLCEEVRSLGLGGYFTKILSAHSETDGSDKKTELIKNELVPGQRAFIVGDTEADIKAGKLLGQTTVAVLSGIRDKAFLAKLDPDFIIPSVADLQAELTC